ncbi:MAG: hypothetical protein K9M07_07820, partial [Simkaniaceae bacterium]|nr:hypothetical protein [Simkaniaceae bacterium]
MSETLVQEPDLSSTIRKKWLRAWRVNSIATIIFAIAISIAHIFYFMEHSEFNLVMQVCVLSVCSIWLPYESCYKYIGTKLMFFLVLAMPFTTFFGLQMIGFTSGGIKNEFAL